MTDTIPMRHAEVSHLQQIIAALTEGLIIIELDGTIAWADDTALALHGARSVADLGDTAEGYADRFQLSYLGGEKLSRGDYPIQRLLAGSLIDRAMLQVTRRADNKRWVHEIRTRVLTSGDDKPDCLVVVLNDETDRFNAETRFERAFSANPAPAIIARLADMRYVKVNHGFLQLTGYLHADLIGRSMHQVDVLRGAEKRELAVARLHAGETIPQMEARLPLADGHERAVLLGGQPLEIGDDACMLFTFADLHPREQAHHALRQTEERFAKAFHLAPVPMAMILLEDLRILDVNDAFTATMGWRREEVLGRTEPDMGLWGEGEDRTRIERQVRGGSQVRGVDVRVRSKAGAIGHYLLSVDTVEIHHDRCALVVMLDITERKQTETELLDAVQSAMRDTDWIGHRIVEKLANITQGSAGQRQPPELDSLPARAREVLDLLASGLSDEEVASRLGIARNTLRNHVAAIYAKVGMNKRSAVIVWARERGLGTSMKPRKSRRNTRRPRTS